MCIYMIYLCDHVNPDIYILHSQDIRPPLSSTSASFRMDSTCFPKAI